MSTLGRKAMRKTLERLKEDAMGNAKFLMDLFVDLSKEIDSMSREEQDLFDLIIGPSYRATKSLLRYVQSLEDYGYELDEAWDKLLKTVEQVKPAQKKEEAKKTSYIK